ncbi:DUF6508 domain-containing protein [Neobacillus drentensis]|uniref:DUF6508 domain-containing protein n=1 Tax=Neobacillus drentensis TaxID=220684 RepID=UPI003B5888AB
MLEGKGKRSHNLAAAIPTANLELLKAILTYYVLQERFCDGLWARLRKIKCS